MKDVKDDNNVTNARLILLKIVRIVQMKLQKKRRMTKRRNEDFNKWKEESRDETN